MKLNLYKWLTTRGGVIVNIVFCPIIYPTIQIAHKIKFKRFSSLKEYLFALKIIWKEYECDDLNNLIIHELEKLEG